MVFHKLALDSVNRAATTLEGAAGKSVNVAKVLKVLGESPVATGFLGGERGSLVQSALEERGITTEFVKVAPETRQCATVIDESAGTITELVQESQALPRDNYRELLGVIRKWAGRCKAMV